jgi:hypothetical protein
MVTGLSIATVRPLRCHNLTPRMEIFSQRSIKQHLAAENVGWVEVLFLSLKYQSFIEHLLYNLANCQAACESRTLNAKQIDESREAILLFDVEVSKVRSCSRSSLSQLGSNTAIINVNGVYLDAWQVRQNRGYSVLHLLWIRLQIGRIIYPLDVGAKSDSTSHVKCEVGAKASKSRDRCWIEECFGFGPARGIGEI